MPPALEFDDVSKHFGTVTAVSHLELSLEPGSFLGLLGRNGAGKTTSIHLATGLLRPTSGRVRALGLDVAVRPVEIKRRIGVMAQDESLLDCLTGRQYLQFVGQIHGLANQEIRRRTEELFETLELAPEPRTLVRDYSYGMKKKLGLSAALIHGPEMIFLDEPFEGIDPVTSRTIKDILISLRKKGVTILMSSHVLEVVEKLCPLIAIIDQGKLLGLGDLDQLKAGLQTGSTGEEGEAETLEDLFVSLMGGAKSGELSWL